VAARCSSDRVIVTSGTPTVIRGFAITGASGGSVCHGRRPEWTPAGRSTGDTAAAASLAAGAGRRRNGQRIVVSPALLVALRVDLADLGHDPRARAVLKIENLVE
jgi:hypothetical protein